MPTKDQEYTDLKHELEVKLENAFAEETQEIIMSTSNRDCCNSKPQVKVELHSSPTDPMRKAAAAGEYQDQEVVLSASYYECNQIKLEPETELSSSTTKRRRKATGQKMKKVEVSGE